MGYKTISVIFAALVLASAAAASPVYWTPAQALQAVTHTHLVANMPNVGVTRVVLLHPGNACKGSGTPKAGKFVAFTCTGQANPYGSDTPLVPLTIWIRPWPTGTCASTVGPTVCAVARTNADPRLCDADTRLNVDYCLYLAAQAAASQKAGGRVACVPVKAFVFTCSNATVTETVTLAKGTTAWTTTVTAG